MKKNIVVVSAHPDDEILGAGGTLIKHRNEGDQIFWLIITNISESMGFTPERVRSRQNEIDQVASRLNATVFKLDYPTMSLGSQELIDMVPEISNLFTKIEPHTIYVMNRSDAHSDHRIVFNAVMACTKSFRYPSIRQVYMYECISETEFTPALAENMFIPNCFTDISDEMDEKVEIMNLYESEMGEHPFPRSVVNIKALATFRGASSGVQFAEAFQLLKWNRIEEL